MLGSSRGIVRLTNTVFGKMSSAMNGQVPKRTKVLTVDSINPHVKNMEYAVRGPIVIRASEIEKDLEKVNACLTGDQSVIQP